MEVQKMDYKDFIKSKQIMAGSSGFTVDKSELNPKAFEWQRDVVAWALKKGKCAVFEDCGLGKSVQQLMFASQVVKHTGRPVLIFAPLAVVQQTVREGQKFGEPVTAVREQEQVNGAGVYITNYDIAEHFDMSQFSGIVLDESSILKDFTSKTKQLLIDMCKDIPYRLCCTATPSPNDFTELGNHAEFLGIMSRTEMLATFFVHDGGNTSSWRLKGHAKDAFFEWVASWACCMTSPRDLGYDGTGYDLPKLNIIEHIVKVDELEDADGQMMLFASTVQTLNERRAARRNSMDGRVELAAEIANSTDEQCLLWCDLNDESRKLHEAVNNSVEVRGTDTPEHKVTSMQKFTDSEVKCLVSKSSIAGWGVNWQQCHRMIFVGLSDSFESYYQSVRRCWRFGQKQPVDVHIIISDAEGAVKANIERKQKEAETLTKELVKHTKDILMADIKSTRRMTETYYATEKMVVPTWLKTEG
jgi:hypothetical protein